MIDREEGVAYGYVKDEKGKWRVRRIGAWVHELKLPDEKFRVASDQEPGVSSTNLGVTGEPR